MSNAGLTVVSEIDSTASVVQSVLEVYQNIHQFPELSMQEYKTAEKIQKQLEAWSIPSQRLADTGVVATLSSGVGPTVAFRADMDGLPLKENTQSPFRSEVMSSSMEEGDKAVPVMHACGHDVHMASALATAHYLKTHPDEWKGTVEFIFQPAEEAFNGAQKMVDHGLWDILAQPEIVFGQHVAPFPVNMIGLNTGPLLARMDCLAVTVRGKGAHASSPQESIDPIVLAAYMITRLQTIVSREVAPLDSAVVTIGTIRGGIKENIISDQVEFTINVRTYGKLFEDKVYPAIQRILYAEAEASGAPRPDITRISTHDEVSNDPESAGLIINTFTHIFGDNNVQSSLKAMGSEDFSTLANAIDVPYVFWFHGAFSQSFIKHKVEQGLTLPSNHQPDFMPDSPQDAIATGLKAALGALLTWLPA